MKYLEYYEKAMKTGKLVNGNGLCGEHLFNLELIRPTTEERVEYALNAYWASGYSVDDWDNMSKRHETQCKFTPLRQTIVLLLAAEAGEL